MNKTCENCKWYEWEDLDGLYWCATKGRIFDVLLDDEPDYTICEKYEEKK